MDRLYLVTFYIFKFFAKIVPFFIMNFFIKLISFVLSNINNKHVRVALLNLDIAFKNSFDKSTKKQILFNTIKNMLFTLIDFTRNQGASKKDILSKISFQNENYLENALENNEKIIIMTAHYGNWELLSLGIAAKFTPLSVVGRDLDSKIMNEILIENREQFDIELLSKKGAMKGMLSALKVARPVGILVDQNTNDDESVIVDFFSEKVRHTPSIALLAKKFNAVIIPAFISTNDNKKYTVKFYSPFYFNDSGNKEQDIINCVQKQALITEKVISEKPDEWFWFHKRWKYTHEKQYK